MLKPLAPVLLLALMVASPVMAAETAPNNGTSRSPLDQLIAPPGIGDGSARAATDRDELAVRHELRETLPRLLFLPEAESRAKTDRLINEFRATSARTPSGLSKEYLLLYGGTTEMVPELGEPDEQGLAINRAFMERWIAADPKNPNPKLILAYMLRNHMFATSRSRRNLVSRLLSGENKAADALEQYLDENKSVMSVDPNWYALKMEVLHEKRAGRDALLALLAEATGKHPGFYATYFEAERAILERSTSPAEDLEALVELAVSRSKATDGTGLRARMYWVALRELGNPEILAAMKASWPLMRHSMMDVLHSYPDQWNTQNFAFFSCLAQDKAMTRELLGKMYGRRYADAWGQLEVHAACETWAATADHPAEVSRASATAH